MANQEEGIEPDGVNPPATQLLDQRIDAALQKRGFRGGAEPIAGHGGGDGTGGGLEARIAKVEASVAAIETAVTEMKGDMRTLRENARTDFRLLFGAVIAVALGLAGIMAKGFHWL